MLVSASRSAQRALEIGGNGGSRAIVSVLVCPFSLKTTFLYTSDRVANVGTVRARHCFAFQSYLDGEMLAKALAGYFASTAV